MWKTILDYPRYEINEEGVIRNIQTKKTKYVRIGKHGYWDVQFTVEGKVHTRKVHRLVAKAFIPNPEDKPEVNHKNFDRTDCRVDNLEWVTRKENNVHAQDNPVRKDQSGENNPMAKLTEEDVILVCEYYHANKRATPSMAVEMFGISMQQATKIRAKLQWKHVSAKYTWDKLK